MISFIHTNFFILDYYKNVFIFFINKGFLKKDFDYNLIIFQIATIKISL